MKLLLLPALMLLASLAFSQSADSDFTKLADRYFDECYFKFSPTSATAAGFHQYDNLLEDYSRAAIQQQVATLKKFKPLVEKIDPAKLSPETAADRELLLGEINGRLLELENIRQWETNPDRYSGGVTSSIFVIMARKFAPADQRLKSVIAREKQIPGVLENARKNLKNPPPIYVDIAAEQVPDNPAPGAGPRGARLPAGRKGPETSVRDGGQP